MSGTSQASIRSDKYYYETVTFEVEGTLYRVLKQSFTNWSQSVFQDMFSLPPDSTKPEGKTDDNPIKLVGCTKSEFESLLEIMHPRDGPGVPSLSKDQWVGVVKLARLWDMPKAAALAIEKLNTQFPLSVIEKVQLGKTYGVPTWLKEGYEALVGDDFSPETTFEALSATLGLETVSRILWARDQIARSQNTATPNSGAGFWVNKEHLSCGGCWQKWQTIYPINDSRLSCSNCGEDYEYEGHGVHVIIPYKSLSALPTRVAIDKKAVADKVAEVFEEELKDAESMNAVSTVGAGP